MVENEIESDGVELTQDDVTEALEELIRRGDAAYGDVNPVTGEPMYYLTEQGRKRAEEILGAEEVARINAERKLQ